MPHEEIYGTRDRSYSGWHRRASTRRFVGLELAQTLTMIDLDASLYVEYDDRTKEPLALIETAIDRGQKWKASTVTKNLARRTTPVVPAFVLLYRLSEFDLPCDSTWRDITSFRVKKIWPEPETDWITLTPKEWAQKLVALRRWAAEKIDDLIERHDWHPSFKAY